uniref:Uncharacterized protein n=1 Tax=Arundo donax TaxID=35708 RepID=A0A0A9GS14_ARUDO
MFIIFFVASSLTHFVGMDGSYCPFAILS